MTPTARTLWTALGALALSVPAVAQGNAPGQLSFDPTAPTPGATVEVEYVPGAVLPADGALDLRARLRTPDRGWRGRATRTRSVATLERGVDGVYRGRFVLPDSVAFALFAVATTSGDAVDTNLEAGWPLLTHGSDGRPTEAAYSEYLNDLEGRDFRTGARVARAFAQDYPERVEPWTRLSFYETIVPTAAPDSLADAARVARFDRALAAAPNVEDASELVFLAGAGEISDRWTDWLTENAPADPGTVRHRSFRAMRDLYHDPVALLTALEAIYHEAGPVDEALLDMGTAAANEAGDLEAAVQWADRRLKAMPAFPVRVARALLHSPLTRAEGARRMAIELDRLGDGPTDARPLFSTVATEQEDHRRAMAVLRTELGVATAELGDLEGARAVLEVAWDGLWTRAALAVLADGREAAGDLEGAAHALARIAADPGAEDRDAVAERGRGLVGDAEWERLTFSALSASRRWALAQSAAFAFDRALEVADPSGRPVAVGSAMASDGPTVVVTFASGCGGCVQSAPAIEALHERLSRTGAAVTVLSHDDPLEDTFFRDREMTVPVVYDVDRSVTLALGSAGTPQYYVVDRAGQARYVRSIGDVTRHLDALAVGDDG